MWRKSSCQNSADHVVEVLVEGDAVNDTLCDLICCSQGVVIQNWKMQLLTTLKNPISLPPTLKVAISISGSNPLTWLSLTTVVTEPEQARLKNFRVFASASSKSLFRKLGYASLYREHVQSPVSLCRTPAPIPEAYESPMAAHFFTTPLRGIGLPISGCSTILRGKLVSCGPS